jgi:predicted O-methyltransferase YrrM
MMRAALKSIARRLPGIRDVVAERDRLRRQCGELVAERNHLQQRQEEMASERESLRLERDAVAAERETLRRACGFAPPGHFYSPLPSLAEIEQDAERIFGPFPRTIPGIEMHESEQLALLARFAGYYPEIPFPEEKTAGLRFYYENPSYSYSDAIFLHCMIRHLRPRRLVEVGSGFSTCAMLDTSERFLDSSLQLTCIEPYPELLLSLIGEDDRGRIRLIPQRLQDAGLDEFQRLEANDVLFIDSTHVSKTGSDVNRIFSAILPVLATGVHVHFHDIFYPFEYPREWLQMGRAWNEVYALRAFLQYNDRFRIVLMNTFLEHFHEPLFREKMPLCMKNPGGSIWIRKD